MKKTPVFIFAAIAAVFLAACGAPPAANNATTNANANAAKPVAAAPTVDALMALDKQANEAYAKGDSSFFQGMLSDKFVIVADGGKRMDKAATVKMIAGVKCEVKSMDLSEPAMSKIDDDTYALTYKTTWDATCNDPKGKAMKVPSPVRNASVWVRSGDKWLAAFHGENPIMEPGKSAAPPKREAKKEEPKKEEPKKEANDPKGQPRSNANVNPKSANPGAAADAAPSKDAKPSAASDDAAPPVKPVPDANTDALVKLHTSGWEAFKAKDAKKLTDMLTANATEVDPAGNVFTGSAALVKQWTETMNCEGITKVSLTDGFASALSPTVELLTVKGTADGKCGGRANGPLYQSAFYVKEGNDWKLAFMFESM